VLGKKGGLYRMNGWEMDPLLMGRMNVKTLLFITKS